MTDQELQQLAREYAEEYSYHKDVADDTEEFLRWLSKTHCIVSQEEIISAYKDNSDNEREIKSQGYDDYVYSYRNQQLCDLFGESTFETPKPTEQ